MGDGLLVNFGSLSLADFKTPGKAAAEGKSEAAAEAAAESSGPSGAGDGGAVEARAQPLQHKWAFWQGAYEKRGGDAWEECLERGTEFGSVGGFWEEEGRLGRVASQARKGQDFYLFKAGLEPKWESGANRRGGRWVLVIPDRLEAAFRAQLCERFWLELVLAVVGEQFGPRLSHLVHGVAFNNRSGKPSKLALWLSVGENPAPHEEDILAVGERVVELLGLKDLAGLPLALLFQDHNTVSFRAANRLNPLHYHLYKLTNAQPVQDGF